MPCKAFSLTRKGTSKGGVSSRKVPQKINRHCKVVRVKPCGKSARLGVVMHLEGKPRLEQDKIGRFEFPVLIDLRVCCIDR